MTSADDESHKVIATNRKAFFNYEIFERAEAGIVLVGSEVKSIREGGLNFRDSFVDLQAYFKNGKVKVEIGLARGKKSHDKRESIKRKDIERDTRQAVRDRR